MPFYFTVHPGSKGGFTAIAVILGDMTLDELNAAAAADCGMPEEDVRAAGTSIFKCIGIATAQNLRLKNIYDQCQAQPAAGGKKPLADQFRTAADINAHFSIAMTNNARKAFQGTLNVSSQGLFGLKSPSIVFITGGKPQTMNQYVSSGILRFKGENFDMFNAEDPTQGVRFTNTLGVVTAGTDYGPKTKTSFTVVAPGSLSGDISVTLLSKSGEAGELRTSIYLGTLIQQVPPGVFLTEELPDDDELEEDELDEETPEAKK